MDSTITYTPGEDNNLFLAAALLNEHDLGNDFYGYYGIELSYQEMVQSWKERQDIIRKGLPAAEKHRVKILVENVWAGFLISALDAERFVDEVNNPWFGVYFDVGNNVRWGVPEHWILQLGSRIGKLDIKEWDEKLHRNEGLRKGFSKELGEGTINWPNIRAALKKIKFSGWATAEVGNADRKRLADIAGRMDKILDLA